MLRPTLLLAAACLLVPAPAAAAPRSAESAAKTAFRVAIPKVGTVTVAQVQLKAAKQPRLTVTNKAGLRGSVTVVGAVAKAGAKKWTARVVVANAGGKSAAGAREDLGFASFNATAPGTGNRGVTAAMLQSFPNVTVIGAPKVPTSLCTSFGPSGALLAGRAIGSFSADDVFDFGDDALCGKQVKGAAAFFGTLRGVATSPVALTEVPRSVATGDFVGDATPDIAVATSSGVVLFVALGDGTFGLPLALTTAGTPVSLAAGDLDLDGIADIIVAESSPNQVEIFSGGFLAPRSIVTETLNAAPLNFTTGNANTDADLDLFVATSAGVQVLENNGRADFSAATSLSISNQVPVAVAFGRIDGDAVGDVVYVGEAPGSDVFNFWIFTGNGNDTFGGPFPHGSFIADHTIYGPGSQMIVLFARSAATYASGGLRYFPNVFPSFNPEQFIPAGTRPVGVVAADVNRDNLTDLIALNRGSGTLSTDLGTASGGFTPPIPTTLAGSNPVSAAMLDFNNDAVPDIAVANAPPSGGAGSVDILAGNGQGAFRR